MANMIIEVSLQWLKDNKEGRWIGRYKNINGRLPSERYFIADSKDELTKYLDTLL